MILQPTNMASLIEIVTSQPLSSVSAFGRDMAEVIPAKFHPPKSFKFPLCSFGSKGEKWSFRAEWCSQYNWLHYDSVADGVFCHVCLTAEFEKLFLASTKRDPAL